jgi:RNA polymerase sigma-70 factor (ECF subfamily)
MHSNGAEPGARIGVQGYTGTAGNGARELVTIVELVKERQDNADAQLAAACRAGEPGAFSELVRLYRDRVYSVAYRFLGDHEDAQDVAQEVFVRAYRGIEGFQGNSKIFTWLYSIAGNLARNRIRDRHRKGRDNVTSLEGLEQAAPGAADRATQHHETPEAAASAQEMESILQACLVELPEHYRMVFVLRTFEQLSYDEIADTVGCPKGTVKSRLNQARSLLHGMLKERGVL